MIIQELHDSPYRGVFHEVGVGMEVTASLLRVPGASKTVIGAHCDYAGLHKPKDIRAVSLDYARRLAYECLEAATLTLKDSEPSDQVFGMAVTAVDYPDRTSHAWIYISRLGKDTRYDQDAYMHINFLPNCFDREQLGRELANQALKFLHNVLLRKIPWSKFCREFNVTCGPGITGMLYADVIYAPGISDIERLFTLTDNASLVFHQGKFHRVVDYLRKYHRIYGGSFDPPHDDHMKAGKDSLFLLSTNHCYKGGLSMEDIYHRMRMLDIFGVPVLIMKDRPMFWQKHKLLNDLWPQTYKYILGSDAWNTMIAAHQYPTEDFMRNHFQDAIFEIILRKNETISSNQISNGLILKESELKTGSMSSTSIRGGNYKGLDSRIVNYIKTNKLYSEGT